MLKNTDDLRIKNLRPLISPAILIEELPITKSIANLVSKTRNEAEKIIHGQDDRLLVIVGPCSIHDPKAALDYAKKLRKEVIRFKKELCIIMRVYFEKPRTTVGWKGLINDPKLDGSFEINHGLHKARQLLIDIAEVGVATGTEFLDTIIPQFISDLISWGAIGARTTESQVHRELASGLSMPIGFKNGTSGDVQISVDAIRAAHHPHHFLSVTKQGIAAVVSTTGNNACHVILRGSNSGPNYDAKNIASTIKSLQEVNLTTKIMVDCSHGNSNKDHTKQAVVVKSLCEQINAGSKDICGVMIESNLVEGKQTLHHDKKLVYGQSVTDGCISWENTKPLLQALADAVKQRRTKKGSEKLYDRK
jgi:3-deoxy-7-phosphoheptulonate synthase